MRLDLKTKPIRILIEIKGKVQGVGFRPTVYRYAVERKLIGWVSNSSTGVIIEVQGTKDKVEDFIATLKKFPPSRAEITALQITEIKPQKGTSFKVLSSIPGKEMKTRISPDIAVCKDCLRELFDNKNRRYLYPFINCTNCGPRFTIIKNIPYDRFNTTMKEFKMCKSCQDEYDNPSNRRFHAQPNACSVCGPQLSLIQNSPLEIQRISGTKSSESFQDSRGRRKIKDLTTGRKAIEKTTKLLKEGKIVAIKGLGGFHLACDALNDKAVKTLRSRKYREDKPFALMAKDLKTIKQYCEVSPEEEKLLLSWKSPVVILRKSPLSVFSENKGGGKKVSSSVSKHVAPNNKYLGFMLPYTPLHHLLFSPLVTDHSSLSILVMTSGNISDEPIAYNNDEAMKRLKNIADYFLLNDRDIYMRCDDSVTRIFPSTKKEFILRRSRGYTPDSIILRKPNPEIPIDFSEIKPWGQGRKPILAVGGHSKNTFAIAKGDEIILSEHIGDLENVETYNSFVNGIEHFKKLLEVEPKIIAHDLHPDYLSTQYAKNLITVHSPLTTIPIQHHHAHIASVMADNMLDNRKVIGVAFDGTGLGLDLPARLPIGCGQASQQAGGNLWGGEFLIADYVDFKRVAHFKYIPLPGGEKAIKEPWRIAFSYLYSIFGDELWGLNIDFVKKLDKKKSKVLQKMIDNGINTPLTSSIGRLFDAVASLIGVRNTVNYEGQAAIELEMIINDGRRMRDDGRKYKYLINRENGIYIIDMDETIKEIIKDLRNNVSKEIISLKFHNTIVELIVKTCMKIRSDFKENHELRAMSYELNEVALGGGVFQNMFLLTNAYNKLKKAGFRVYIHEKVPTNDGGLSLGQAVIAGYRKI